jgi:AcrR family transcriptional regulator
VAPASVERQQTEEAFLDAAERVLVSAGHAGVTTRALAQEAKANHGLVHYYFGSMENLLARVLERFTERLIARQRAMYSARDVPFIDKWRAAMRYLDADRSYQKIWYELQANAEWRAVLTDALAEPHERYGIEMPLGALVSLVITFNEGIIFERLSGIEAGQAELLEFIDRWIEERDKR